MLMPMLREVSKCSPKFRTAFDRHQDLLRDPRGLIGAFDLQQQNELVAAFPADGIGAAHARLQAPRHLEQQPVADIVTEAVVDLLESIPGPGTTSRRGRRAAVRRRTRVRIDYARERG